MCIQYFLQASKKFHARNAIVKRFANILALLNKYMPAGQLHFGAIYGSKS